MAIYHFSTQIIGRSSGKSAVASAAYRAGEKMYDEHTGLAFDYTRKQKIDYTEIIAPDNAPAWVQDREKLWNEVEFTEKRKDAQLAREFNIALPVELNKEQQIELVRNFSKDNFVDDGMIADIAIHNQDGENPHAHIMLTTREIGPDGFGKKNREWNERDLHNQWREEWANYANRELERIGSQERIDHRSLEEQGIDREPQIHVGPVANAMEKRNKDFLSERGEENRKIIELNKYREQQQRQIEEYKKEQQQLEKEIAEIQKKKEQQLEKERAAEKVRDRESTQQPKTETVTKDMPEQIRPATLEDARKEVNETYDAQDKQSKAVADLQHELQLIKSTLWKVNTLQDQVAEIDKKLSQINKFNPFQRSEFKELQGLKAEYDRQLRIALGQENPEALFEKMHQKEKTLSGEERKLADIQQKHEKARDKFSYLKREEKKIQHKAELKQAGQLHAKMKAGHKLSLNEMKLVNTHAKELNIKPIKIPEMKMPKMKSLAHEELQR